MHFNVLLSWPTNKSFTIEFSVFEYQSHIKSALVESLIESSNCNGDTLDAVFNALCNVSKKKRKNSCESCWAGIDRFRLVSTFHKATLLIKNKYKPDPEYILCLLENAYFKSDGVTLRLLGDHILLINLANSANV